MDAALASLVRGRVAQPLAGRADGLVEWPEIAVEHAAEVRLLVDAPDLPADCGPGRLRGPGSLDPADPPSSSASHARTASRENRHSSPILRAGISLRSAIAMIVSSSTCSRPASWAGVRI